MIVKTESPATMPSVHTEFVSRICVPFLKSAQNQDGGWGFKPGSQSRVEATSWAVFALCAEGTKATESLKKGLQFLRAAQLADGSWPASPTQTVGCWTTSLALWALMADPESHAAAGRGVRWICEDLPRGRSLIKRVLRKIARVEEVSAQNDSLHGWGWTPKTASWVEPTAFALIALGQTPKELLPNHAAGRVREAKVLIYDRMCPGGGWNCGNPMVYGVAGEALVEPTVWALLALRNDPQNDAKAQSLEWLEKNVTGTSGPGSVALAKICLEAYGRTLPADRPTLPELFENNGFLGSVLVVAWTCLALGARRGFLE